MRTSAALLLFALLLLSPSAAAATFVVNSTADPGDGVCDATECTLREALHAQGDGPRTINFNIPGTGPFTITLVSDLLDELTSARSDLTIDGYTQPGSHPNTADVGSNAVLPVVVDGANLYLGLRLNHRNTVRGLVLQRFSTPFWIIGDDNVVTGCFIGTDATGTLPRGNGVGVYIKPLRVRGMYEDTAHAPVRNRIGGPLASDRNVIAASAGAGVLLDSTEVVTKPYLLVSTNENVIEGNLIGISVTGEPAGNHGYGIDIPGASSRNVFRRNVISGNFQGGIRIAGVLWPCCPSMHYPAIENAITGNLIGTGAAGTGAIPNGMGIKLEPNALGTIIGGATTEERNVISGNATSGIELTFTWDGFYAGDPSTISGNYIGADISGNAPLGNGGSGVYLRGASAWISRNVIVSNGANGIHGASYEWNFDVIGSGGNRIHENLIGRGVGGATLGNVGSGILFDDSDATLGGGRNRIGDDDPSLANVIAHNGADGVTLRSGSGNAILGNSMFANGDLPIDLNDDGPTPNDPLDADSGPNGLQNHPVLTFVSHDSNGLIAHGVLDSTPATAFTIQLFDDGVPSALRGAVDILTDASGHGEFAITITGAIPAAVRATAVVQESLDTSEMSAAIEVGQQAEGIPALSHLMLALLAVGLAGTALRAVRRA